jgi:uncharacterized membrane protein
MNRTPWLDTLRGFAMLWMTLFHFSFDLNYFGFIRQNFYHDPFWTIQRTCILSLFLFCAGFGQALAVKNGQTWARFGRRWLQIAACALAVSAGSAVMFPNSWIYFGVLHGMAVMLLICRATASWGAWGGVGLWILGAVAIGLGNFPPITFDAPAWNWIGLISRKPITEDYVPILPWLGVMWWGMAAGLTLSFPSFQRRGGRQRLTGWLSWLGQWSLPWYMLHQPVLIGLLTVYKNFISIP